MLSATFVIAMSSLLTKVEPLESPNAAVPVTSFNNLVNSGF